MRCIVEHEISNSQGPKKSGHEGRFITLQKLKTDLLFPGILVYVPAFWHSTGFLAVLAAILTLLPALALSRAGIIGSLFASCASSPTRGLACPRGRIIGSLFASARLASGDYKGRLSSLVVVSALDLPVTLQEHFHSWAKVLFL